MEINLDREHDVLYIGAGKRSNSYGDESVDGVIVLKDIRSEKVTGVTILDFTRRYSNHSFGILPLSHEAEEAQMHTTHLNVFLVRDECGVEFTVTSPEPLEAASTHTRNFCKRVGWTFLGEDRRPRTMEPAPTGNERKSTTCSLQSSF